MRRVRVQAIGCLLSLLVTASTWAANFSVEAAGAPPADGIPAALSGMLQADGVRVKGPDDKLVGEYWGRKEAFTGDPISGYGIRFDSLPEGALVGIVRFPEKGSDFREQHIPPGIYTLRYGLHPEDGNHMGAAASRDFVVLTPLAGDADPAKNYGADELIDMSFTIGNPHPTIARIELPDGDGASPHIWQNDMSHWLIDLKVVDGAVGLVVYGHSEE